MNEINCLKMSDLATSSAERISRDWQIPVRSTRIHRMETGVPYSKTGCTAHIDTPFGLRRCSVNQLFTDDGGKTIWGSIYLHTCH